MSNQKFTVNILSNPEARSCPDEQIVLMADIYHAGVRIATVCDTRVTYANCGQAFMQNYCERTDDFAISLAEAQCEADADRMREIYA